MYSVRQSNMYSLKKCDALEEHTAECAKELPRPNAECAYIHVRMKSGQVELPE